MAVTPLKKRSNPAFETFVLKVIFFEKCNINKINTLIKAKVNKCKYPIIKYGFKLIDLSTKNGNAESI